MITLIESLATAVLLILLVLLVSHMLSGSATAWVKSKVTVAPA